jgi:hypothetical protein
MMHIKVKDYRKAVKSAKLLLDELIPLYDRASTHKTYYNLHDTKVMLDRDVNEISIDISFDKPVAPIDNIIYRMQRHEFKRVEIGNICTDDFQAEQLEEIFVKQLHKVINHDLAHNMLWINFIFNNAYNPVRLYMYYDGTYEIDISQTKSKYIPEFVKYIELIYSMIKFTYVEI